MSKVARDEKGPCVQVEQSSRTIIRIKSTGSSLHLRVCSSDTEKDVIPTITATTTEHSVYLLSHLDMENRKERLQLSRYQNSYQQHMLNKEHKQRNAENCTTDQEANSHNTTRGPDQSKQQYR